MSFQCSNPDFTIRSTDDGTVFEVKRSALETSQVFKGMFSCCDESTNSNQVLDLPESAGSLSVLLQLLHTPPLPPRPLPDSSGNASVAGPDDNPHQQTTDSQSDYQARTKPKGYDPSTIIPFPLLKLFLQLADKYEIESSTLDVLASHLMVYAIAPGLAQPNLSQVDALDVYALATTYGMDAVASKASQHVKSMASYGIDEVRALPTVQAYHKLVKLQDYRVKAIRELVLSEPLFPHGEFTP
ncbi:hypothetical protein AX16_005552 [Volvariella volvacea WC 439]|nr:hypothetical protein AX16_005552 [Volvariella volvacea WC 439]